MSTVQEVYEEALEDLLSSWTALDLVMTHYDGPVREAASKRQVLLENISDIVREDKYDVPSIGEFINDYMFEKFHMELDDESHFSVAKIAMEAWELAKRGIRPQIPKTQNGARGSLVQEIVEEVDGDSGMEDDEPSQSAPQPRIVTDEDGWSTILPRHN